MAAGNRIRLDGGALCAACRMPRSFGELLVATDVRNGRRFFVCRPSVSDMRLPLCTSRVLGSVTVHAIALAEAPVPAPRFERYRPGMPEHVAAYRDQMLEAAAA